MCVNHRRVSPLKLSNYPELSKTKLYFTLHNFSAKYQFTRSSDYWTSVTNEAWMQICSLFYKLICSWVLFNSVLCSNWVFLPVDWLFKIWKFKLGLQRDSWEYWVQEVQRKRSCLVGANLVTVLFWSVVSTSLHTSSPSHRGTGDTSRTRLGPLLGQGSCSLQETIHTNFPRYSNQLDRHIRWQCRNFTLIKLNKTTNLVVTSRPCYWPDSTLRPERVELNNLDSLRLK